MLCSSTYTLIGDNPPFDISVTLSVESGCENCATIFWHITGNNRGSIKLLFVERSIDHCVYHAIDMRSINDSMQLSVALKSSCEDTCEDSLAPSYRIRLVLQNNVIFSSPSIVSSKVLNEK